MAYLANVRLTAARRREAARAVAAAKRLFGLRFGGCIRDVRDVCVAVGDAGGCDSGCRVGWRRWRARCTVADEAIDKTVHARFGLRARMHAQRACQNARARAAHVLLGVFVLERLSAVVALAHVARKVRLDKRVALRGQRQAALRGLLGQLPSLRLTTRVRRTQALRAVALLGRPPGSR